MAEPILVSLLHLCVCLHKHTHMHQVNSGNVGKVHLEKFASTYIFPKLGCCLESGIGMSLRSEVLVTSRVGDLQSPELL